MPKPVLSDEDFIRMFQEFGAKEMARRTGMAWRMIYKRRANIERKLNLNIRAPGAAPSVGTQHPKQVEHPARQHLQVENGVVLVGSDAHYWPGDPSTAHRAFVKFCRDLRPDAVVMNGDVLDGATVSRHPPIGWESRPSLVDEIIACQTRLREIVKAAPKAKTYWTLGNHDCLDPETELLTKRGWVRYQEIDPRDEVFSLDGDKGVWTGIDEVVEFPFSGELVAIEKTRMSMAVTPNHRVLIDRLNWRTGQYDKREYRRADDLPYSFNVPMTAYSNASGVSFTDAEIALAGWLLTDGNIQNGYVSFYQSKAAGRAEIESLLAQAGFEFSVYERQRDSRPVCGRALLKTPLLAAQYRLKAMSSRRMRDIVPEKGALPDWAWSASRHQFNVLLSAIVAGDGTWDGTNPDGHSCCVIYGEEEFLSSLQAVAVTHGWRARLAIDNRGDYRLWLNREQKLRIEKKDVSKFEYEGMVWCLRVPHGNFMVRRNGAAYFTGNSRLETRIATVAPEFAKIHGMHLKDHFGENWINCWSLWINDNTVIKHRYKGGIHATHNNAMWSGKSVVTGHLHSLKVTPLTDYNGTRYGVDCGTLAVPYASQFVHYTEDNPVNWRSGFAVLTFHKGRLLWPEVVSVMDEAEGLVEFRGKVQAV